MKKWKMIFSLSLAMLLTLQGMPVYAAELQNNNPRENIEVSAENVSQLSDLEGNISAETTTTVNPDDVIEEHQGEMPQPRVGISTKYGWDNGTTPYDFTQQWSTNTEIYSTYPYYDDGLFYPASTVMLNNPKGSSAYNNAVREGYLNDEWATQVGLHAYYHTVSSTTLNSVTVLLDENVAFQVYDAELNPVLDTSSAAYEDLLLYHTLTVSTTSGTKEVHTLKLVNGNYYIMFAPLEGESGNYHYAMFTGNPLPIQQSYTSSESTHNGSVKWDQRSSSQTYQCPAVSISISSGAELFSVKRISFQDFTSGVNNAYVSSVEMMYQSPNSYSYETVATRAGLRETWIDTTPASGSIVGTYNTKVKVNWMSGLSYVNASYFTVTMMTIDYLVPLGEVSVSF